MNIWIYVAWCLNVSLWSSVRICFVRSAAITFDDIIHPSTYTYAYQGRSHQCKLYTWISLVLWNGRESKHQATHSTWIGFSRFVRLFNQLEYFLELLAYIIVRYYCIYSWCCCLEISYVFGATQQNRARCQTGRVFSQFGKLKTLTWHINLFR